MIQVTQRFSDAQDLPTLARMLDDLMRTMSAADAPQTQFPQLARPTETVREGMMIQARPNSTVRRAGRTPNISASGIVTRVINAGAVEWAPLALVSLRLPDVAGSDEAGSLWLGEGGGVICTKPTSGLVQKVGQRLALDARTGKHRCQIQPGTIEGTSAGVPAGVILMWSGLVATIPSGWALCNGTNGTPDLRNLFVVGAYADVGGAAVSSVSGSNLHTGGANSHVHTGTTDGHSHSVTADADVGSRFQSGTDLELIAVDSSDATDTFTTGSTSSLPPYMALAYIMKL